MKKNINNMTSKKAYIRPEISSVHVVHSCLLAGTGEGASKMSVQSNKDEAPSQGGIWSYRVGW